MLEQAKKVALTLSVIVLFALYALQERTRVPVGSSTVLSGYATTATPGVSSYVSTLKPLATRPVATVPSRVAGVATVTPAPSATATVEAAVPSSSGGTASSGLTVGTYRDGTYTGSPADANWGNLEVQTVITNGHISDVQFLEYPNHRSRSRSINERAMPLLAQEAIQAQQAEVDIVTGATDTSEAFIESLASALRQATA